MDYVDFFNEAGPGRIPYHYQQDFAERRELPQVVELPTGAGRTAMVLGGWIYRRRYHPSEDVHRATPRRLVYCLPMRAMAEPIYTEARRWLDRLGIAREIEVHLLDEGRAERDWTLWPGREAIVIGAHDVLLSRALTPGHAANRTHWPTEFEILANDCLWVFDEVQLMEGALTATAQFAAVHRSGGQPAEIRAFAPCQFLWISTTLRPGWLQTPDHPAPSGPPLRLSDDEKENRRSPLWRRLHAAKTIQKANFPSVEAGHLAREVLAGHIGWTLREAQTALPRDAAAEAASATTTLVVMNTVERAESLFEHLRKLSRQAGLGVDVPLLDCRFPHPERIALLDRLAAPTPEAGRIVVATQAVEVGIDISARLLFTELAPWPTLVDRFGRCNRAGEFDDAQVYWLEIDEAHPGPYSPQELADSRQLLQTLELGEVGPMALERFLQSLSAETLERLYAGPKAPSAAQGLFPSPAPRG